MGKLDQTGFPKADLRFTLTGPVWLMQPIPYFGEPVDAGWIYEPKFDGWRLQIIRYQDGRLECWGRRLEKKPNWTERLNQVAGQIKEILPPGSIIDCELTTKNGRRFIPSLFAKSPNVAPLIYIFDVIFYENEFVGDKPLLERKRIIQKFHLSAPFQITVWQPVKDIALHLRESLSQGYEGIVIKHLNSPYVICQDGPLATEYWRKIKSVLIRR
ncbi:MAG: hypothetical protein ABIK39_04155 [candidate division WOR-3 bacterium]